METITIKQYKFEELSEEAKKTAIQKNSDINISDDWSSYLVENLEDSIKQNLDLTIGSKNIYYEFMSRNNSVWINSEVLINALRDKYAEIKDFDLPSKFGLFCNYLGGGLCSGLNESEFNMHYLEFEEDTDKLRAVALNKMIKEDLEGLHKLLEKFYKGLYESYNYLVSDESIKETLEVNEYDFDEFGEMI